MCVGYAWLCAVLVTGSAFRSRDSGVRVGSALRFAVRASRGAWLPRVPPFRFSASRELAAFGFAFWCRLPCARHMYPIMFDVALEMELVRARRGAPPGPRAPMARPGPPARPRPSARALDRMRHGRGPRSAFFAFASWFPPRPPPPGSKFDFKMLKIIVLSTRGFAHGEGSSCCSGPCSSAQEPAARAFTHSMSRTNKTLYRSPHRALSLSLSRHFDQGAQMDRPNTVTTQYMLLFSQRSVALPSVELSQ